MDIGNIVNKSLGYPLSNKKNFLILGLIILIADSYSILTSAGINNILIALLMVLSFLVMILRTGYSLRILESSIGGSNILPDFGSWRTMFKDGVKLLIVALIYFIPLILILFITGMAMGIFLYSSKINLNSPHNWLMMIIVAVIILYTIIIYPVVLMASANMAHNDRKLSYALNFGEIRSKISELGIGNFVGWYIVTVIIYSVIVIVGTGLTAAFGMVHVKFIGQIINSLLIGPFATIFLFRSTSLMYRSQLAVQSGTNPDNN